MDKKFELVINDIKYKITQNVYIPGKALPKETELAEQYGFSRVTIRRAMQELVSEGVVYRISGRGTFINAGGINPAVRPPNFFIVMPYRDSEMFKFVHGIEEEMARNKYLFSFFFIDKLDGEKTSLSEDYDAFLCYLSKLNPNGIFCYPPNSTDGCRGYKEIIKNKIPLILLDKEFGGCPVNSVVSDNYFGMYDLTRYVVDKGHRKIGYLSYGDSFGDTIVKRKKGFLDCLKDNAIEINDTYIKDYAYDFKGVKVILNDLLTDHPDITAIVCSNDSIAERCYPEL